MKGEKPTAVFEVTLRAKARAGLPPESEALKMAHAVLSGTWVPSQFNVSVDLLENRKAVYNTFTGAVTIQSLGEWQEYLESGSEYQVCGDLVSEQIYFLYSKGFLVNKNIDELDLVRQKYLSARHSSGLLKLNILPTLACNLRCPYCFEGRAQSLHKSRPMSEETQDAVVRYVNRQAEDHKRLEIVWIGGEPLLNLGIMERISAQITPGLDKAGIDYNALVSTNGTLLNQDTANRLKKCRISQVQVSIDVPKAMKKDNHGVETLERVLDRISIAANELDIHIRVNLSRDDEREFDELYDGLIQRNLHNKLKSIHIAHVYIPEKGREGCAAKRVPTRLYLEATRRETAKAKALGIPLKSLHTLTGASPNACSATCESSTVIGPGGLLYKCIDDAGLAERAYGSVFLHKCVRPDNLLPWLTYDWFKHKMCRECPVLPQCGGGCVHKRMFQSDSLRDEDFCYWNIRGNLEDRIREYAVELLQRDNASLPSGKRVYA